ncbi:Hypothetical predicted protein [Paramuricea clavata]|uniref:Uncharacterized protein n=1 Tax=Paramuricea clavata TaxID=317549 RepID=A0A6S7HE06_PARCT|nr:Hypothetical predicted protein [Paramuricea clavata]
MKKHLGFERYTENVMKNTPIGKSTTKMKEHSEEVLKMRFNTAYCLAKKGFKEKPFNDYPELLALQEKKNRIDKQREYRTPLKATANFIDFYYLSKQFQKIESAEGAWYCIGRKTAKIFQGIRNCTRWIGHHYNAIKIVLKHYGAYMMHLEELSKNDSQTEKREQFNGYLNKMSLSEQKQQHDPVKAVRRIQEFKWTMVKLHGHVREALDHNELNQAE